MAGDGDTKAQAHLTELVNALNEVLIKSGEHYVAFGPSPRTPLGHCVVMQSGEYAYDPASGGYLGGEPWLYVFFVAQKDEEPK